MLLEKLRTSPPRRKPVTEPSQTGFIPPLPREKPPRAVTQYDGLSIPADLDREVVERFWGKITKSNNCWEWAGTILNSGYGQFSIGRKGLAAHRVAYALANGGLTAGLFVCHTCDNRRCVRPDHLFLGTNSDNMKDALAKGRLVPRKLPTTRCGGGPWKVCIRGHDLTNTENRTGSNGGKETRRCRLCANARARRCAHNNRVVRIMKSMPESPSAPSASQLDELALSAPILEAIRECDGDTFAEPGVRSFLEDFLASYPRCTTCGLRCSPSAKLDCSACAS